MSSRDPYNIRNETPLLIILLISVDTHSPPTDDFLPRHINCVYDDFYELSHESTTVLGTHRAQPLPSFPLGISWFPAK